MNVILEAKLFSAFQKPDYENKKTGEVTKGKFILQLMSERVLKNGDSKNELQDVSIPDSLIPKYKGKEGQVVQVKSGLMIQDNRPTFYGVE